MIYVCAFIFSLVFMYTIENNKTRNRSVFSTIFVVLPLILLASCRDSTVGSDTSFYQIPIFKNAILFQGDLPLFLNSYLNVEILYLLLNYGVACISHNIIFLFLILYSLVIIPMFIAALKLKKYISPTFFWLIFLLIEYNESLSTIRQSIALSLSVLMFVLYFLKKKWWTYVLCGLIAIGFHNSAVVVFLLLFIYKIIQKYPINKSPLFYTFGCIFFIMMLIQLKTMIAWGISNNFLSEKYLIYLTEDTFSSNLGNTNLMTRIIIAIYMWRVLCQSYKILPATFFLIIAILDVGLCFCGLITDPLYRLSYYPRIISCISIPYIVQYYPIHFNHTKKRIPIKALFCALLTFYWWYVYIYGNYADTAEYKLNSQSF